MTAREIILSNIEYRSEDLVGMVFTNGEGRLNDFCSGSCEHGIVTEEWQEERFVYSNDIWGNVWYRVAGMSRSGEVFRPVLESWDQLDSLELPDLANPANFEHAREIGRNELTKFKSGFMPGWPFATCRYMRRMDTYFVDLIAYRDEIDALHDRVTTLFEGVIDQFGEAGMDGIFFCEDLGVQDRLLMSPAMWRDIFRPLYERLTARAHSHGMKVIQHTCGFNWDLVDDLCEAGIDCLQFDQPAIYPMEELSEKLKLHGVGLYSPCDIQKVLPTGDRSTIEAESERLVATFRGGLIAKDYGDLHGIGVDLEWDNWAYETFARAGNRSGATGDSRESKAHL